MSFIIELKIPDIGNATDVEVAEVLIKPGDTVELEQTILVLETDKATMDLPATAAGTIQDVKLKVGDKVAEGVLIATLVADTEKVAAPKKEQAKTPEAPAKPAPEESAPAAASEQKAPQPAVATPPPMQTPTVETAGAPGKAHASPAVRRFARELGVDITQIKAGSGRKGRILFDDVKNFVKQAMTSGVPAAAGMTGIPPIPAVDFAQFGPIEEQPLNKIKRLTAQGMIRNWLNMPMVTYHDEADITEMETFRKTVSAEQAGNGVKITPLVFIVKALLAAMTQYPQFNSSLSADGGKLIYKKYFHIGIAVDTPNGLVVPVIRNADQKSLIELAKEMAALGEKARAGKLAAAEMQGGCFTISSLGGIGGTAFTPIVNAPEVAILGVTRAAMKPVWNGQEFVPRLMLPLDLTYDHRVIDGADGARFTSAVVNYLGDIRRLLL
jgi:pyruvate dehydrogenase E2 component (dihydrolipoamide acetyltransferase)